MQNSPAEQRKVWREDSVASLLSVLVVAGLFIDGWSHLNRFDGRLGSFFTPWHGLLYAAFSSNAAWVVSRNRHLWHPEITPSDALFKVGSVALRYPFAVIGLLVATVGMVGDVGWHTAFGEEAGVARVIAPFHVLLVLGASLLLMAPLRSAWNAPDVYPAGSRLPRVAPAVLSLALGASLTGFVFQWVSPYVAWSGAEPTESRVAIALVSAALALGVPVLLCQRQWPAATGAGVVICTSAAFALSSLGSHRFAWTIGAAFAGGVAADLTMLVARRWSAHAGLYAVAVAMPMVTWPVHFAILDGHYGQTWPADLALGVGALGGLQLCIVVFILSLRA